MNGNELYEKRVRHGLAAAAVLGLLIALVAATPADRARLNEAGAIAKVNERHIDRTEFASAYQALLSDKTKAPTQGDKKLVLARLIEETQVPLPFSIVFNFNVAIDPGLMKASKTKTANRLSDPPRDIGASLCNFAFLKVPPTSKV